MITLNAVSKIFGEGPTAFQALRPAALTINAGEFFTLLGPSGCGKTTLVRLIAGSVAPSIRTEVQT